MTCWYLKTSHVMGHLGYFGGNDKVKMTRTRNRANWQYPDTNLHIFTNSKQLGFESFWKRNWSDILSTKLFWQYHWADFCVQHFRVDLFSQRLGFAQITTKHQLFVWQDFHFTYLSADHFNWESILFWRSFTVLCHSISEDANPEMQRYRSMKLWCLSAY